MRTYIIAICACFAVPHCGGSQVIFRTVLPQQPVIAGESFLLQYVLEDAGKIAVINPPVLTGFRLVNGPYIHTGTFRGSGGARTVQNFVYTVEAIRTGKFLVRGATTVINGRLYKSNDVFVEVISPRMAARLNNKREGETDSGYFLRPGEDPYEKIRQNLFLKILTDKKSCFVGEPVMATFKLYSRLESKSDILKNPGFYGFAVYDMINLANKEVTTEQVNGRVFDVHTIRQVQLYPYQAGTFTIDPMEVQNRVEFSRSAVNRKTEQEIVEGLPVNEESETRSAHADIFETRISTPPVDIRVKPITEKNKPPSFTNAVGRFSIRSGIKKDQLSKNEQGVLELTISGQGNFIQLTSPVVTWPAGIESFEPAVKDSLDKLHSPLAGSRTFRYAFVPVTPGDYTIPPVVFSFFNPDSGKYNTIATEKLTLTVSAEERTRSPVLPVSTEDSGKPRGMGWVVTGLALLLGTGILYWLVQRQKSKKTRAMAALVDIPAGMEELFAPATLLVHGADQDFYAALRQALWQFLGTRFRLSGSGQSKEKLLRAMRAKGIDEDLALKAVQLLQRCEEGIFTTARLAADKNKLLEQSKALLDQVGRSLHSEYL